MLKKRIIPCLDIQNGQTVKGVNFINIKQAGDPVELAEAYSRQGADELVFLDITATNDKRKTLKELVAKIAARIQIPFTVGGGVNSVHDVALLLEAGADKISINSAAVHHPELITELAKSFGSQCIVVAIDTNKTEQGIEKVFINGGKKNTDKDTLEWAKEAQDRGAGEILLTSMNADGTKMGFDLDITSQISRSLNIPVIASGGAGKVEHFKSVFQEADADAALAASVFHFGEISIPFLKQYLHQENIPIRI